MYFGEIHCTFNLLYSYFFIISFCFICTFSRMNNAVLLLLYI